ncbi:nitroreductase [Mycobacteroides abscessus subsp. abscessus]|nr:nitroreductase [Mycobacteroides abscessus subsp. abscessus]
MIREPGMLDDFAAHVALQRQRFADSLPEGRRNTSGLAGALGAPWRMPCTGAATAPSAP